MDIEYLLWLQNLRESWGSGAEFFITLITEIPKSTLSALIPGILFWCINRRAGLFLMAVMSFGKLINSLLKDTFCVYRPWFLSTDIHPAADAMQKASSYSFPSGHTQFVTAIYGGIAYFYRKKYPLLIIPCVLIILAVAFSRNFLGVHTPQDVFAAIVETVAVIFLADKIFNALEEDKRLGKIIFGAGIAFIVISAIYMFTKSYPVDYSQGKIIVSAAAAKIDSIASIGINLGFLIGAALEHKFVNFSTNVDLGVKVRRVLIGGVVGGAAMAVIYIFKISGLEIAYEFLKGFMPLFSITFLTPYAFNYFEQKTRFKFKKFSRF